MEKKPEAGKKFNGGHLAYSFEVHKYLEDIKRPGIRIKVKATFNKTELSCLYYHCEFLLSTIR